MSGGIAARKTAATGSAAFKWQPLRMIVAAPDDMCGRQGLVRVIAWHFVILRQSRACRHGYESALTATCVFQVCMQQDGRIGKWMSNLTKSLD